MRAHKRMVATAKVTSRDPCWGACLQGIDASVCGRVRGLQSRHFKTKFCDVCRFSMTVPAARMRILTDEMAYALENRRSMGVWTEASPGMGGFRYRIVNNTQGCFGGRLIVFESEPPRKLACPPLDSDLVDAEGMVHLCVCRGTAVPIKYVQMHARRLKRARHEETHDSGSETPTLCEVVMPSTIVQLADESLCVEEFEEEEADEDEEEEEEEEEEKPLQTLLKSLEERRKHRNRQSAAKSRIQKREYIAHLESRVCELSVTVHALKVENCFWKSLGLVRGDATCPLAACEGFVFASEECL